MLKHRLIHDLSWLKFINNIVFEQAASTRSYSVTAEKKQDLKVSGTCEPPCNITNTNSFIQHNVLLDIFQWFLVLFALFIVFPFSSDVYIDVNYQLL
jgi:hypothetical protein